MRRKAPPLLRTIPQQSVESGAGVNAPFLVVIVRWKSANAPLDIRYNQLIFDFWEEGL
jgi:hypothetical protein